MDDADVVQDVDAVLPGADGEISTQLERILKRQGLNFELGASAEGAQIRDGEVVLTVSLPNGERQAVTCDCVLVAVGSKVE